MAACEWDIQYPSNCPEPDWSSEDKAMYEEMAVDLLWNWTNHSFGLCTVTVRPCRKDCERNSTFFGNGPFPGGSSWQPVLIAGKWYNVGCFCSRENCSCTYVPVLTLPGPVAAIEEIVIDGQTLDPDAYRVDNGNMLVRMDGDDWPICQDLGAPPGQEGTWTITYSRGAQTPIGGRVAAGVLAAELYKAACEDETCNLPQRVQTVTREGVTVAVMDQFEDVEKGRTGIWLIDSWVASVSKTPQRATVHSPDLPKRRGRVQTWP